ncbi:MULTISPECIES: HNH endonuclease [Pseudomonas]|uniref:Uncharacterized protein n=1 Tax=Pseudomonas paracarnis TaxID=2750625 RepID=A0ABU6BXN6_9PSED|nr:MULTISPECIES: hypothetical protein [Pseudomonas]KWV75299.1 hypothetical protein PFLuk1_01045 [Pseudomonas fluorescens]MBW9242056.1 hypothetical protein [Pseudomonas paracarnis]MEB3784170.1 hypothetical protein [Pseudomonas paracarnis]OJT28048.1 hypothetical protein BOP96_21965 [Pseudomonas sp. FSL W5-0203]
MSLVTTDMMQNLERMRAAVTEWLIKEEMLGDAFFIGIDEWRSRGECYGTDSLLVLAFDGSSLHTLLSFGGDTQEFDDLVESFGFWYELGHSWNMGFYPVEGYDYSRLTGTYASKLKDPRWTEKAALVKKRAGEICQDCGANQRLDAHHCYYTTIRQAYEPWEYPLSALRALCRPCHLRREQTEIRLRAFAASLTSDELDALRPAFDHATYWYKTEAVLSFLSQLGPEERHRQAAMQILREGKNEND